MHASREEMAALQQAIGPLARALAARLAMRRRRHHRGQLDFRWTVAPARWPTAACRPTPGSAGPTRPSPRSW